MSELGIIITAIFTFLGTCVVSYRMIMEWKLKIALKKEEHHHALEMKRIEAEKENLETANTKAINELKVFAETFRKQIEIFTKEIQNVTDEFKKIQESQSGMARTFKLWMEQAESRIRSMEDALVKKYGDVILKAGK